MERRAHGDQAAARRAEVRTLSVGAVAAAAASAGSPPAAASIAAAAAAPDETSRCLPIRPPLLCATRTRPAPFGGFVGERAAETLGGLDDAAAVHTEPVHHVHAVARGVQRIAERPQERPVLVHAGQQDDLGEVVRSLSPRARRRPRSAERPRRGDDRELSPGGVRVVQRPPPPAHDHVRGSGDVPAARWS